MQPRCLRYKQTLAAFSTVFPSTLPGSCPTLCFQVPSTASDFSSGKEDADPILSPAGGMRDPGRSLVPRGVQPSCFRGLGVKMHFSPSLCLRPWGGCSWHGCKRGEMEAAFQPITSACTLFLLLPEPAASPQVPSPALGWPPLVLGRPQFHRSMVVDEGL